MSQSKGPGDKEAPSKNPTDHHSSYERTPGPGLTEPHPGKPGNVLENILDCIEDAVYVVDGQCHIIYANSSLCSILGKEPNELLGKGSQVYFSSLGYESWGQDDAEVLRGGKELVRFQSIVLGQEHRTAKVRKILKTEHDRPYVITIIRYKFLAETI